MNEIIFTVSGERRATAGNDNIVFIRSKSMTRQI